MSDAADDMFSAAQEEIASGRGGNASTVTLLAQEMTYAIAQLKVMDEAAAMWRSRVGHLRTKLFPEAMKQFGSTEMKVPEDVPAVADLPMLPKGTVISMGDFVAGSLPKEGAERAIAIKHLEECEGEALIKTAIVIAFNKSEHNLATSIFEELKAREEGLAVMMESSVHPQSLCAFARERMADGKPIEPEKLGLFVGQKVDVKPPKEAKPKAPRKKKGE